MAAADHTRLRTSGSTARKKSTDQCRHTEGADWLLASACFRLALALDGLARQSLAHACNCDLELGRCIDAVAARIEAAGRRSAGATPARRPTRIATKGTPDLGVRRWRRP